MKTRVVVIICVFFLVLLTILILVNSYSKNSDELINNSRELINKTDFNNDSYEEIANGKGKSPVLKNLGINIEPLDKKTNLAGDLIFTKSLMYDDGHVFNDKVFIDFGNKDKYNQNNIGNIEYWFFVPLNTKIKAPIEGIIKIDYFEHTKDWGISIYSKDSDLIVSFEHLVNLMVKDGNYVNSGDFIGEASPRNTFGNKIAMTELAVWSGGETIMKYCPFDYLDEPIKQIYKEKLDRLAEEWEEFIGKDVYEQEKWVSPGCLVQSIKET